MGFSSELCSPQGHGAVQQMQEAELRLLEGMRKWMAQRVKSDREYAGLLHHMSLQDSGGRGISPNSPISQVGLLWDPRPPRPLPVVSALSARPLLFPEPTGEGWRIGRPGLGSHCPPLPVSPAPCHTVLGRDHQPDGGPEPVAEAARGGSELRAPEQAGPADPGAAAAAQDLQRAVAAAAAGAQQGGQAALGSTWPVLPEG